MNDPEGRTAGYCVSCGDYVLGRFVRVLNSNSDAVDGHRGCTGSRPPVAARSRRLPGIGPTR